jgi:NTE family protein
VSPSKGITLVLGGMGIKGVANFGALRAFRDQGIPIRRIISTGLSSIAAAQFSLNIDHVPLVDTISRFFIKHKGDLWGLEKVSGLDENEEGILLGGLSYFLRARLFCRSNIRNISILSWDLVDPLLNEDFINFRESELSVPIAVSAIDLVNGQEVLIEKGSIIDRLKVSLSFPGILPPVEINGSRLTNSSLYCELPLGLITEDDRPVVAIDIPNTTHKPRIKSIIDVVSYVDELRSCEMKQSILDKADHVITLENLNGFHWGNYILTPRLVSQAYRETTRSLQEYKQLL